MKKWIAGLKWPGGFWFRIFGYGLHIERSKGHCLLFSERYGYKKAYYVVGLRIEFLSKLEEK